MEELLEALRSNTVLVSFTKTDGTKRDMKCTLNSEYIPGEALPKSESNRKQSTTSVAVFDIEKQQWRSFKNESIISWSIV